MADKFKLDVVTPSRLLVSEEVEEVTAPGVEGEFGVLPGHTPFLTALGVGELMYRKGTAVQYIAMCRGFAEVTHEKATILAEEAEFPHEIDVGQAEAARVEAEKEIATGLSHDSKEYLEAQGKLERALNRIHVASRRK
jgi:F-type H+-transporting ATPase subunit epsilon